MGSHGMFGALPEIHEWECIGLDLLARLFTVGKFSQQGLQLIMRTIAVLSRGYGLQDYI